MFSKSGDFRRIGNLVGMSLVNGGSGFPCFAPAMFDYICGKPISSIAIPIDEIPDVQLQQALKKVFDNFIFITYTL